MNRYYVVTLAWNGDYFETNEIFCYSNMEERDFKVNNLLLVGYDIDERKGDVIDDTYVEYTYLV